MVGDFASGLAQAFSDYLSTERERTRKSEDDAIGMQMDLIKTLSSRPDANPALLGKALHDLVDLQQAKGGRRKSKGGTEGFLGATELPMSQFLKGIQDGSTPMMGNTTEPTPAPQESMDYLAKMTGVGKAQPMFNGQSVLDANVPVPPDAAPIPADMKRLTQAAQDVSQYKALGPNPRRPVAQQPILRSPEEMAQQEGRTAGVKAGEVAFAQKDADVNVLRSIGFSEPEIQDILRHKYTGKSSPAQSQNYVGADGKVFTVQYHPDASPAPYTDMAGNAIELPHGARRVGLGPTDQFNFFQDDLGNVTGIGTNRYQGTASSIPVPPGVQGRTSPEGPAAVDPTTNQVVRLPRRGTNATPVTVTPAPVPPHVPAPPGQTPTVIPPQQPQPLLKFNADQQKVYDSINQAKPMIDSVTSALDDMKSKNNGADANTIGSRLHGIKERFEYATGFQPDDPIYQQVIPLVSFLKVFLTQPYLRGMRNYRYVQQIQDHMPGTTDTPALMREKLGVIQSNLADIEHELVTGGTAPTATVNPIPPAPAARGVGSSPSARKYQTVNVQPY